MAEGALSIKLRCASWQQLATIYKRDLSHGTMFLRAATPPPVGTEVRIDLSLPSATVIALSGVVQSHVNDPQRGTGVELKLAPIPAGSVWLIESALAAEQKRVAASPAGAGAQVSGAHHLSGSIPAINDSADVSAAEQELIKALVSEAESLKKLNPFLVLGVGYEASDAEVRAAFGELTKRYHPDRFARYESDELRQVAAEIFILIRDAYRRLGDGGARAQVLQSLGKPAPGPRAVPGPRRQPTLVPPPKSTKGVPPPTPGAPPERPSPPPVPLAPAHAPTAQVPVIRATTPSMPSVPRPAIPSLPRPGKRPTDEPPQPPVPAAAPVPVGPPGADLRGVVPRRASTDPGPGAKRASSDPGVVAKRASTDPGRRSMSQQMPIVDPIDASPLEMLIDEGKLDEALNAYRMAAKKSPTDRNLRAGVELCEGLRALAARDRLEAAQRFEAALEIDPSNERAARELADMRRQATNERKGLLSRLMGKKEP